MNDICFALRQLLKNPGFTAVAVLTLALGIGANTAIFSVVNALFLDPFPYRDHNQLVQLRQQRPKAGGAVEALHGGPEFDALRQGAKSFAHLAAIETVTRNLTVGGEQPERGFGAKVSADFFPLLGVAPLLGRTLLPDEEGPAAPAVVVLGHGIWQIRFGGDPAIIGRAIELDGEPFTIVGVMPPRFNYASTAYWFPFPSELKEAPPTTRWYGIVGRLKPGVSLDAANAELKTLAARIATDHRETGDYIGWSMSAVPLRDALLGNTRPAIFVLSCAVAVVLLIACANVAGLLLVRAATRQREVAIRAAIGASRWQLLRQFLLESLALAAVGGTLGVLVAVWGVDRLIALIPAGSMPAEAAIRVSPSVLLFAGAITLATTFLFGLWPALQASRADAAVALRSGDRSGGPARSGMRSALVVLEIASAVVLLAGAGLLVRSFVGLTRIELGFRAERVLSMRFNLSPAKYPTHDDKARFAEQLAANVSALPGVESAAVVSHPPFSFGERWSFALEGGTAPSPRQSALYHVVSANYHSLMGIPLLRGRAFTMDDRTDRPIVAIVNDTMARRVWPGVDPIGQRLVVYVGNLEIPATVVGVARDARQTDLEALIEPQMDFPVAQAAGQFRRLNLIVRTHGDPATLTSAIRAEVQKIDRALPAYNVTTLQGIVDGTLAVRRLALRLLALFAGMALVLALAGIYGVTSFGVAQRTHEIGIRMALGASRRSVIHLVLGSGMRLVGLGIVLGGGAALGLTRLLGKMLYGVEPTDPATFAGVALLLLLVSLFALWLPARRAARVDPMVALRAE